MSTPQEQIPQAQPTKLPKRWPLVNKLQTRTSVAPLTKDARLINCYAEYDPEDKDYQIYKRVGLSPTPAFSAGASNTGYGSYLHQASGFLLFVFFNLGTTTVYYGSAGVLHSVGTVDGSAPYFFETVNSSPQSVVLANGKKGYIFNVATQALTAIAGAAYPPIQMTGWAYVDGTLYAMDQLGNIFGSNLNDPTTWNALNVIPASSNADQGVALAKQLNYVVAFKAYTTQIFYDAGNPTGSPLAAVPDAQIPLGCASSASVQQIDNTLLWITANQTASPQVAMLNNLTPSIVSTPAVQRILEGGFFTLGGAIFDVIWALSPASGITSWVLKHAGHRFYGLSIQSSNITLVYDLDQDLWYIWLDSNGNWWPIASMTYVPATALASAIHYAQHTTNGNVYALDASYIYPNDFGNVFPVDIYTPNLDFGTVRRKTLKAMYFNADRVPSSLITRFSDDDYNTWSNPRAVDLNLKKPRLTNCGTFKRRRAYHLRHLANTPLRIKSIDLQMDLGTL